MEKSFTQTVAHSLGREKARRQLDEGLPQLLALLPGGRTEHRWSGDTMFLDYSALGQSATAELTVFDESVVVTITVRGVLAAMGDRIATLFGRGTRQLLEDRSR